MTISSNTLMNLSRSGYQLTGFLLSASWLKWRILPS